MAKRRSTTWELLVGTVAGCCASLAGQPIDTVRVRVQCAGIVKSPAHATTLTHGAWRTAYEVMSRDGVRGLFRGWVPPLLACGPRNAIGFAVQGTTARWITNELQCDASLTVTAIAGVAAGLAQCVIIVPADRVKCQQQVMSRGGALDVACSLVASQGVWRGLFTGLAATACRQGPSCAVYFSSYSWLQQHLVGPVRGQRPFGATLLAGGLAGCCSYLVTYPLDVVKTVIQGNRQPLSLSQAVAKLHTLHGPRWLVRAAGPTLARAFVINAINFAVFEHLGWMVWGANS